MTQREFVASLQVMGDPQSGRSDYSPHRLCWILDNHESTTPEVTARDFCWLEGMYQTMVGYVGWKLVGWRGRRFVG